MAEAIRVLQMPSMGLAYFALLRRSLEATGCHAIFSSRFPRRGLLFGSRLAAVHLHMLDQIFGSGSRLEVTLRIFWFKLVIYPAMRFRGIRLVWTCHELSAHEGDRHDAVGQTMRFVGARADTIIVHNTPMRDRLTSLFPDWTARIMILPPGDLRPYYGPLIDGAAQANLDRQRGGFAFHSIGYMRENKGNDLILKAFARLDAPNARLVMSGNCADAAFRECLIALAAADPRVTLDIRDLTDREVVAAHLAADVVVFAFRDCPTSGSVITAMSLERAVIAPAIGHVLELVDPATGWTYSAQTGEDGLLAAMQAAMAAGAASCAMGQQARARIARDDWTGIARRLMAIYAGPRA